MNGDLAREDLKNFLEGAQRVAVVGIGQRYRHDDAAGIVVVENLYQRLSGSEVLPLSLSDTQFETAAGSVRLFQGYETPESLTGSLRKFSPTHVVFVDAAQLDRNPGTIEIVPTSDIQGEELSTHNLPLSILGEFLEKDLRCKVVLLGIQPFSIELTSEGSLSEPVQKAVVLAVEILEDVLK